MDLMIPNTTQIASINADTQRQSGLHMKPTQINPSMDTAIKGIHSIQTGLSRPVIPEPMLNNHNHTHNPDVGVAGPKAVAEAAVMAWVQDVVVVVVEVVVEAALQTEGEAATWAVDEAAVQAKGTGYSTPEK